MRERLSKCELPVAAASILIALIATLAGPRLNHGMTRDRLVAVNVRRTRQVAGLQAALRAAQSSNRALETELAGASIALENAQSQLAALVTERDALAAEVATSACKTLELEGRLATITDEAAQLKELLSLHELSRERDAATARAEKAEERIRQLTLELHRSGVWP
jgi:chromosome segregation ATPase